MKWFCLFPFFSPNPINSGSLYWPFFLFHYPNQKYQTHQHLHLNDFVGGGHELWEKRNVSDLEITHSWGRDRWDIPAHTFLSELHCSWLAYQFVVEEVGSSFISGTCSLLRRPFKCRHGYGGQSNEVYLKGEKKHTHTHTEGARKGKRIWREIERASKPHIILVAERENPRH